jgi:hypothetical protein
VVEIRRWINFPRILSETVEQWRSGGGLSEKVVEIRRWINFPRILSETVEQRRGKILMPSFSGSLSLTSRFDKAFLELNVVYS